MGEAKYVSLLNRIAADRIEQLEAQLRWLAKSQFGFEKRSISGSGIVLVPHWGSSSAAFFRVDPEAPWVAIQEAMESEGFSRNDLDQEAGK